MKNSKISKLMQQERCENLAFFLAVFLLIAVRFLYCGFEYFPQLDDYIQHHNYAQQIDQLYGGDMGAFIDRVGLLAARPLAGLLDITLWSWLWECSIVSVLLISVLFAAATVELSEIFKKLFGTSHLFTVFFALFPLTIEGTYWLSASTRLIPGLFFCALSAKMYLSFLNGGKWYQFLISFVFQLLTFGFYEQPAVLSCALNCLIGILFIKNNIKRALFAPMGLFSAALYFLFTSAVGESALYGGRSKIFTSVGDYYINTFLPKLLVQIKSAFLGGGFYTLTKGFVRGVEQIFTDGAVIYILIIAALCVAIMYFIGKPPRNTDEKAKGKKAWLAVPFAILIILAPLAPYFIIEGEPWFSFRGTLPSLVGVALLTDTIFRCIVWNNKKAIAVFAAAFAFVFCICSVSEISDYKASYINDMRVVKTVAQITSDEFPQGGKVGILNVEQTYLDDVNALYHEHIVGVTESSWALTGAVRCYNDRQNDWIEYVPISLSSDPIYAGWEYGTKSPDNLTGLYRYDFESDTLKRLVVSKPEEHRFVLSFEDGTQYGEIIETPSEFNSEQYVGRFFAK